MHVLRLMDQALDRQKRAEGWEANGKASLASITPSTRKQRVMYAENDTDRFAAETGIKLIDESSYKQVPGRARLRVCHSGLYSGKRWLIFGRAQPIFW